MTSLAISMRPSLIAALTEGQLEATLTLAEYEAELFSTPADFRRSLIAAWGEPADDLNVIDGAFRFRFVRLGKLIVAVQPDRGDASSRKRDYHDLKLPPRHAYVAFHFWLTRKAKVDADHSTRRARHAGVAAGESGRAQRELRAEVVLGPTPRRLPVHCQQSRRGGAGRTAHRRGHHRPSDAAAGRRQGRTARPSSSKGCSTNSPRRRNSIRDARARSPRSSWSGDENGIAAQGMRRRRPVARGGARRPRRLALRPLEMRVGDGLTCWPRPSTRAWTPRGSNLDAGARETLRERVRPLRRFPVSLGSCARSAAASSRPGRPARRRAAVSTYCRPGAISTPSIRARPRLRNAWEIGRRAADEISARYAQDARRLAEAHRARPFGRSATMCTGGDDLAQALRSSAAGRLGRFIGRVSGFEV